MSHRTVSRLSFVFFIIIGIAFYVSTFRFSTSEGMSIGPQFFPRLLSILLILFCILGLVRRFQGQEDNGSYNVPGMKYVCLTIVLAALFIISWHLFGLFYLQSLVFLFLLFNLYRPFWKYGLSSLMLSTGLSVSFTLFIYIIFGRLMHMNF